MTRSLVNLSLITTLAITPYGLFAKEQHGAHEHGKAELSVAIDGMKVTIALESPAESIYGFEHEAKKPKDVTARDDAAKKLKDNAATLFQFAPSVGCTLTDSKIEPWVKESEEEHEREHAKDKKAKGDKKAEEHDHHHEHGEHGEVHANYTFTCTKSLSGSKLTVTLLDSFPKLREIAVQLISDQKQSGSTLKAANKTIDL